MARYVAVLKRPDAAAGAERRTAPRVELQIEVGLSSDSNFYTGLTQDISTGGVFVATHQLHRVGQHVTVHLTLPGAPQPISIDCEVRWIREVSALMGADTTTGMGLKFVSVSPQARQAIATFFESRESIFHDEE